jgi:hypothetical protein
MRLQHSTYRFVDLYEIKLRINLRADPSGHAVKGVGLGPSACWDRGFESHRGHGCLSLYSARVVRKRSLGRADPSSRGVLPTVVYA